MAADAGPERITVACRAGGTGLKPLAFWLTHWRPESSPQQMTASPPHVFSQRHLLGIVHRSREEIVALLDPPDEAVTISRQVEKKRSTLRGRTQINLFFEASTRTQSS